MSAVVHARVTEQLTRLRTPLRRRAPGRHAERFDRHGQGVHRKSVQQRHDADVDCSSVDEISVTKVDGPSIYAHPLCPNTCVVSQQRDPDSLLSWLERVLRARRECPEFGWGTCEFLQPAGSPVLMHRCRHQDRSVVAIHNLSSSEQHVRLALREGCAARDVLARAESIAGEGSLSVQLEPYGYRWFREERTGGRESG